MELPHQPGGEKQKRGYQQDRPLPAMGLIYPVGSLDGSPLLPLWNGITLGSRRDHSCL